MKTIKPLRIFLTFCLQIFIINSSISQILEDYKDSIKIPFKNLPIENIQALGDKKTGAVKLSFDVKNNANQMAAVAFTFGGYENFGFVTDKGIKYTVHTYYNSLTDENHNKGYQNISAVVFGSKKMEMSTTLQQEIEANAIRTLTISFNSNKTVKEVKNFHINCTYSPEWVYEGSESYYINKIAITWK